MLQTPIHIEYYAESGELLTNTNFRFPVRSLLRAISRLQIPLQVALVRGANSHPLERPFRSCRISGTAWTNAIHNHFAPLVE